MPAPYPCQREAPAGWGGGRTNRNMAHSGSTCPRSCLVAIRPVAWCTFQTDVLSSCNNPVLGSRPVGKTHLHTCVEKQVCVVQVCGKEGLKLHPRQNGKWKPSITFWAGEWELVSPTSETHETRRWQSRPCLIHQSELCEDQPKPRECPEKTAPQGAAGLPVCWDGWAQGHWDGQVGGGARRRCGSILQRAICVMSEISMWCF